MKRLAVALILAASAAICFGQHTGGGGVPGAATSAVTWPTSGDAVISNGTNTPAGLAPVNGDCLLGAGGVWTVGACGSGTVTSIGVTTANGVSGTSSGGATPSLTLSLGAIAPTSVAATGAISATGGITATSDGVHAGLNSLVGNTTLPSLPASTVNEIGPSVASFTAYGVQKSSTGPSAVSFMEYGAPSSSVSQESFVGVTGTGNVVLATAPSITQVTVTQPDAITTTNCLAATAPITTPCIAARGSATALGNSGTSGTVTLYTSNAPAGVFTVCPVVWVTTSAGTGPGNITLALTYTSPGSLGISAYNVNTTPVTAYDGFNTCNTVATKSGTTFSFVIAASGASGSASSWEYSYVVTRLE